MNEKYFLPESKLKTLGPLLLAKYSNGLRLQRNRLNKSLFSKERAIIQKHIDQADSYRPNFKK